LDKEYNDGWYTVKHGTNTGLVHRDYLKLPLLTDWGIERLERELKVISMIGDPEDWSRERVGVWLGDKGFKHLVALFENVNGRDLMRLSLKQLRDEFHGMFLCLKRVVESLRDRIALMHEVLLLKTAEEMPDGIYSISKTKI
jgi:hypothetical protein